MELTSKTRKKKVALSMQALGEQLVTLSIEQLTSIDLQPDLHKAVLSAKKIKKHGPLLRQMQYIGALMRKCDPKPIQEALDRLKRGKGILVRLEQLGDVVVSVA